MYPLTVQQICDITDGAIHGQVRSSGIVDGCVIDSRDVQKGDAFFALGGQHQHGVKFATQAITAGADLVIVDEHLSSQCRSPHVTVRDAEIALAQLAQHNRRQSDALIVGITGSVGKTTTRSMIAAALGSVHQGIQSPRNFNNHLGVPLSLLELQEGDEFGVIEIAASAPGEVRVLTSITEPEFAVVTRVAPAHLRGLGSLKAVQQAKAELVQAVSSDAVCFLNIDDPLVAEMASVARGRVVTYGLDETADVRGSLVVVENDRLRVTVDGFEFSAPICGRHNAVSLLAAIAVGFEIGIAPEHINAGLHNFVAAPGRCHVSTPNGLCTVIDDTYNSNPAGVKAAIQTLEEFSGCRHRILALSDMLDLGDQAPDLHYGIGIALASSSIHHVAVTGTFASDLIEGFMMGGGNLNRISEFTDLGLMATMLDCIVSPQDVLLVKGSRTTQMERLIAELGTVARAAQTMRVAA